MQQINPKILEQLKTIELEFPDEALLYLLSIHYNLNVNCIPMEVQRKVNLLSIVQRVFPTDSDNHSIKWLIPLFEGQEVTEDIHWKWVDDWRNLFKKVNPERDGVKQHCIMRMKKFFSKYPSYRQEDIMAATKAYLATVSDPIYCKKAHKFIFEDAGQNEYSHLLEWCERLAKNKPEQFKKMGN